MELVMSQEFATGAAAAFFAISCVANSWLFRQLVICFAGTSAYLSLIQGDGIRGLMAVSTMLVTQIKEYPGFGHGAIVGAGMGIVVALARVAPAMIADLLIVAHKRRKA
jgi:hypothetical protein